MSEKRIASLCTLSSVLLSLLCFVSFRLHLFVYCPYFVFFPLCHRSRYEGDMSLLDAPDA